MRAWAASLLLLAIGASTSWGEEEAAAVPLRLAAAVEAWSQAHASGDAAFAQRIATAPQHDPARVGAHLLEVATTTEAALKQLRRWRADAEGHPSVAGLERLIARLASEGEAVRTRERSIAAAIGSMSRAPDVATADRLRASLADLLRAPGSFAAWRLRHHHADRLRRLGASQSAEQRFLDAAAYASASDLIGPEAHSLCGAARVMRAQGARDRGLRTVEQALAQARACGHPRHIRDAATLHAGLLVDVGRPDAAMATMRANAPSDAWLDPRDHFTFHLVHFNLLSVSNRPTDALAVAERLLASARRVGGDGPKAHALRSLGAALDAVGRYPEAIERYHEALSLDLASVPRVERLLRAGLASIWTGLGRHAEAEAEARRALAVSRKLGRPGDEAQDLLHLAQAQAGLERYEDAATSARSALRIHERGGNPLRIGEAQRLVARLLWHAGAKEEAYALLEAARTLATEAGSVMGEVYALWIIGAHRFLDGDVAAALSAADRGGALLHPASAFQERFARLRCAALHRLGRHAACIEEAVRSIAWRRRMLGGLSDADARFGQRQIASAAAYGLRSAVALGRVAEAFGFIEAGRAMQLNAALRTTRHGILAELPASLRQEERNSEGAITRARANLLQRLGKADVTAEALRAAEDALASAWQERERVLAAIERVSRRAAVALGGRGLSADALQGMLAPGDVWIAFHVAEDILVAVVVTPPAMQAIPLGPYATVDRALEDWRRALSTPGADDRPLGRRLYDRLLAPLGKSLSEGRRLLIAPDGGLAAMPLAALVAPDGRRVIETHELLYVPSATSYALLRGDQLKAGPGQGVVVVAGPDYAGTGLVEIPGAAREGDDVERIFAQATRMRLGGEDASLAALRDATAVTSSNLRVLHLAVHAFVDPEHPARSGLVLAQGEMLTVDVVRRMRLRADLVTLSCCDGARGTPTAGEGQRGLVRAFFVAGARRIVASCWRVSDAHAPGFMARFYEAWQVEGMGVAAALRTAQLERLRADSALAHPAAWASFVAWGIE